MNIFAIGDLHLSGNSDKPMDIFGWQNHKERIFDDWTKQVKDDDIVLICGDTSWAMKMEDAYEDLMEISALAGQKFLIRGNHDYWWGTLSKLKGQYSNLNFIHNTNSMIGELLICGSRGWSCPGPGFTEDDWKIYERELRRLEASLETSQKQEIKRIIAMIHYPPMNENHEDSGFTKLFEEYGVQDVVYGHLHGSKAHESAFEGNRNGVRYHLVACDYLNFRLKALAVE